MESDNDDDNDNDSNGRSNDKGSSSQVKFRQVGSHTGLKGSELCYSSTV